MNDLAVSCRDLRKYYADVKAVDGLDLFITRGECFAPRLLARERNENQRRARTPGARRTRRPHSSRR